MAAPIVYRYDDGNAPVLDATVGSLNNLLKKCLVEGYGDKPAAGWTLEFEDVIGNKIALRNNPITGTGFFLNIVDNSTTTCSAQGYETMTGLDSYTGPFLPAAATWNKIKANTSFAKHWALIATDTFFHLIMYPDSNSTIPLIVERSVANLGGIFWAFFGDFIKSNDEGFNCVIGAGEVKSSYGIASAGSLYDLLRANYAGGAATGTRTGCPRGLDGLPSPKYLASPTTIHTCRTTTGYQTAEVQLGPPYSGDVLFASRRVLFETGTYTLRGFIPGVFLTGHDASGFYNMALQTITHDARTFLCVPFGGFRAGSITNDYYSGSGAFLIEINAEWNL